LISGRFPQARQAYLIEFIDLFPRPEAGRFGTGLAYTKTSRTRYRSDQRLRNQIQTFDGGRHVSSEEIIDQPTIGCKEGYSGHNRNCQFEAGGVAQSGDSPVAPHGREAGDKGGQEGGAEARWLDGCSRPMNRKAGRGKPLAEIIGP
jgi:hypothetical protein